MQSPKPNNRHVYARLNLNSTLIDLRPRSEGIVFGKVKDLCRQYGIKYKELGSCIEFSAPQSRLQHFIEKLHFSKSMYSRKPF